MQKIIDNFSNELTALVETELIDAFLKDIKEEHQLFKKLHSSLSKIKEPTSADHLERSEQNDAILEVINRSHEHETISFSQFSPKYCEAVNTLIAKLPEKLFIEQLPNCFIATPDEHNIVRLKKGGKAFLFELTDLPRKTLNLFRKKKAPKKYWSHKVPLKNLIDYHIRGNFNSSLVKLRSKYFMPLSTAYLELKDYSMNVGAETFSADKQLGKTLTSVRKQLKTTLNELLAEHLNEINRCVRKVNTIEHSGRVYREKSRLALQEKVTRRWDKEDEGWTNTFFLLFEDWRSDMEIIQLIALAQRDLVRTEHSLNSFLQKEVLSDLEQLIAFIGDTVEKVGKSDADLSKLLKARNYDAQKNLDEVLIPRLMDKLSSKNLINSINGFENNLSQALKNLGNERSISKESTDYKSPISTQDIASIALDELIAFDIYPKFKAKIAEIKGSLIGAMEENIKQAGDFDHMITFGLNSAIEHLRNEPDDLDGTRKVAIESLERTSRRVGEVRNSLQTLLQNTATKLQSGLNEYNEALHLLTIDENVSDIRLRIIKSRTIQQSKAYRSKLVSELRDQSIKYLKLAITQWQSVKNWLSATRQRFILTSKKQEVSKEVSDFLNESQQVINSLPIIYRNLYRIEPLSDMELFVGRKEELQTLVNAYLAWNEDKMSSAILYSEKWSGLSSLINYFQVSTPFKHAVEIWRCDPLAVKEEQLHHFLKGLIDLPTNPNTSELAELLIGGPKRVIIVEDIQNLYLRKIGGFEPLRQLIELIQLTNHHVFWLCSCTLYSWEYFKRTHSLHEAFTYRIPLQKPKEDELTSLVEKRNRISGYKIIFQPDDADLVSKKFTKKSNEEQQQMLKKRFFNALIDYSESNISMALTFWLLSTQSVDNNEIYISSFKKPDLAFLGLYSMDKILAIHALVLHDGLTQVQYTGISRGSEHATRYLFTVLHEDGILMKKGAIYLVNPLVYRSVISLLKSKNLIY